MRASTSQPSNDVFALFPFSVSRPNVSQSQCTLSLWLGGELFDRIVTMKYFTEDLTAKLIENLLGVLKYMHSLNICHRDLKPENLLMKDAAAKKVFEESDDDATSLLTKFVVHVNADLGTIPPSQRIRPSESDPPPLDPPPKNPFVKELRRS